MPMSDVQRVTVRIHLLTLGGLILLSACSSGPALGVATPPGDGSPGGGGQGTSEGPGGGSESDPTADDTLPGTFDMASLSEQLRSQGNDVWGFVADASCPTYLDSCLASSDCQAWETCVPGGCNGQGVCVERGRRCDGNADCPEGSTCLDAETRVCVTSALACSDSRTCPPGFGCGPADDAGGEQRCIDRRVPCEPPGGCPVGMACRFQIAALPFCVPSMRACDTTDPEACGDDLVCINPDQGGAETGYCYPAPDDGAVLACTSHLECAGEGEAGEARCSVDVQTFETACRPGGPCALGQGDCVPTGGECAQVHEGMSALCIPDNPGNDCSQDADCGPNALCGDFAGLGQMRCLCWDQVTLVDCTTLP